MSKCVPKTRLLRRQRSTSELETKLTQMAEQVFEEDAPSELSVFYKMKPLKLDQVDDESKLNYFWTKLLLSILWWYRTHESAGSRTCRGRK